MTAPNSSAELDALISAPDDAVIEMVQNIDGDIAVLGAGGKMGFHLCQMLRRAIDFTDKDSDVISVSRFQSVRASDDFKSIGCKTVAADLSDHAQLAALPECPSVFYLAGVKFGTSSDSDLLQKMNVTMPRLVAERFANSRIVALSTGCVYSFTTPQSGGSKETDPTDPPGDYAQSCLGREQAFFDAAARFGTRSSIIRLNYSIDLRYGVLVDLAQKVRRGETIDLTMGYVNVIWQGDAIGQIIRSLEQVAAPPFLLNITGPEVLQVRKLAEKFAERFGCDVKFQGDPAPTAWLNNPAKATKLFGLPKVSIDQMVDWVAEWIDNGGELLGKPTHFETRDGNY